MASLVIVIMPLVVLVSRGIRRHRCGRLERLNPGAHGLSEILYAFTSQANNNGSAFARTERQHAVLQHRGGDCDAFRTLLDQDSGLGFGRVARSQKDRPWRARGYLPTHTPLFIGWLIAVVVIVGALVFFPADALGPIVEHLQLIPPVMKG